MSGDDELDLAAEPEEEEEYVQYDIATLACTRFG